MTNIKHYKRTIFSWSIYDFANQPFTTLVITFIYGTFLSKIELKRSVFENLFFGILCFQKYQIQNGGTIAWYSTHRAIAFAALRWSSAKPPTPLQERSGQLSDRAPTNDRRCIRGAGDISHPPPWGFFLFSPRLSTGFDADGV